MLTTAGTGQLHPTQTNIKSIRGQRDGNDSDGRAYKVSYNRPFIVRDGIGTVAGPQDFVFSAEYAAIRWLEQNGFDVTYIASIDAEPGHVPLTNYKVFMSVGHDEYWSGDLRTGVEAARDAGVHLIFMSGNEVFWKTRWEADSNGTPNRILVCYKETRANAKIDPTAIWTGTWRDPSFSPPSDGGRPENALTGTIFQVDSYRATPSPFRPTSPSSGSGETRKFRPGRRTLGQRDAGLRVGRIAG